jgi:hypothetical protein|tara:strand:- start:857 stop:1111 length:255 start_codon:yes stop_codon:yes gene_type:complete
MKKKLAIILNCAILNPVSERNNNEINKMNNENIETIRAEFKDQFMSDNNTVLVSCCGCGEELHISHEEASQWTDTDWFQCHECE